MTAKTISGPGFAVGGPFDMGTPGVWLAGKADAVTWDGRLSGLSDDELVGVLGAWRRLESWSSAGTLAAAAELARRRPAGGEFVSDEIAAALTMSGLAASILLDLALDLATRLPGTARALREGVLDYPRARLIAEATRILSDDLARQVEVRVLTRAGQQTPGRLRAALARAVIAVDPEAAARRREEALKDPRVRRWQEDAGTAALAGYSLPPAEVLEADQRLTARALALREAGLAGPLEELRARAYLDALLGRDSTPPPAPRDPATPTTSSAPANPTVPGDPAAPSDPAAPGDPASPAPGGPTPPAAPGAPPDQRRLAARVNLTVPLATVLGQASDPGSVAGFGPVDAPLARHLTGLAAGHPASRFCLTITDTEGHALGHSCLPGPRALDQLTTGTLSLTIHPIAQHTCDHRHHEPGYHPSRQLAHLIAARTPTCTAPSCARAAARCDLDHTTPHDQGGPTCECNLAPLCRHHHRCKQSQGWHLEQPSPGTMHWTTPAGRHYITTPSGPYP